MLSPSALMAERHEIETLIEGTQKEWVATTNEIGRLTREIADVDVSAALDVPIN